jgi:hypothetical protein
LIGFFRDQIGHNAAKGGQNIDVGPHFIFSI